MPKEAHVSKAQRVVTCRLRVVILSCPGLFFFKVSYLSFVTGHHKLGKYGGQVL